MQILGYKIEKVESTQPVDGTVVAMTPTKARRVYLLLTLLLLLAPARVFGQSDTSTLTRIFKAFVGSARDASVGEKWYTVFRICAADATAHEKTRECEDFKKVARPQVLVYDHKLRQWRSDDSLSADRFDTDLNGEPTLLLASGDSLVVVVDNTNPLLYDVTTGEVTAVKIDAITDLSKVATLIGGALKAYVPDLTVTTTNEFDFLPTKVSGADTLETRIAALDSLRQRLKQWKEVLNAIVEGSTSAVEFVQSIEQDSADIPYSLSPKIPVSHSAVVTQLRALRLALYAAQKSSCSALLDLATLSEEMTTKDARTLAETFKNATRLHPECEPFQTLLTLSASELEAGAAVTDREKKERTGDLKSVIRKFTSGNRRFIAEEKSAASLIDAASDAVKNGTTAEQAAAQIEAFNLKVRQSLVVPEPADETVRGSQVASWIVIPGDVHVSWDEKQTHPITIAEAAPLGGTYVLARSAPITTKYNVGSVTGSLWDVNVAITYTGIASPKFAKVDDPANAGKSIVQKTGSDTHAGSLALLASYAFLGRRVPKGILHRSGLEFGAGVEKSKPAVFLGLSVGLTKAIRLGAGGTYQEITALDGQHVGQQITGDVVTKNTFKGGWYASFSFSLGAIKLFTNE